MVGVIGRGTEIIDGLDPRMKIEVRNEKRIAMLFVDPLGNLLLARPQHDLLTPPRQLMSHRGTPGSTTKNAEPHASPPGIITDLDLFSRQHLANI